MVGVAATVWNDHKGALIPVTTAAYTQEMRSQTELQSNNYVYTAPYTISVHDLNQVDRHISC